MKIFKNLEEIKKCRGLAVDFWTHFCHIISVRFVSLIQNTSITPNQLTISSFVFITIAIFFIASNDYTMRVIGVLLMNIGYVFDCADGQLARHKKIFSPFGPWLDSFTDRIKELLLVCALSTHLIKINENAVFISLYLLFLIFIYHGQEIAKLPLTKTEDKKRGLDAEAGLVDRITNIMKKLKLSPFNIGEQYFLISLFIILNKIELLFYVLIGYGTLFLMIIYPAYRYYQFIRVKESN